MKSIDHWIAFWDKRPTNDNVIEEMFIRGMITCIQKDAYDYGMLGGLADAYNVFRRYDSESETCNLVANEIAAKHSALESK